MKTAIILFLLSISYYHLIAQNNSSQQLPRVIQPSPNVSALQRYGEIPVSAYTGVPNISIPLYQINAGGVSIPISISYHASGVKVADEASRVGLGWVLNAGGVISRTIMGADDFGYGGFTGINYHESTLPDLAPGFKGQPLTYANIKIGSAINGFGNIPGIASHMTNGESFQPDVYHFNFMDYAGKFFLKRNKVVVLTKKEKISIRCLDVNGNAWEVIASDGTKYLFEEYETSTPSGYGYDTYATVKTAWYLTKIITTKGETINFFYLSNTNFIQPVGSHFVSQNPKTLPVGNAPGLPNATAPALPSIDDRPSGSTYKNIYLDKITFDNGEVRFVYSTDRLDVLNDRKLTDLKIYNKTTSGLTELIKQWSFTYNYFEGTQTNSFQPIANHVSKRLKLEAVTEKDASGNSLSPYSFTYNTNDILNPQYLPNKTSFDRDHWGYYNGRNNSSLLPDFYNSASSNPITASLGIQGNNRDPNPAFNQLFSLKEIKYPTGGKTVFEYETNDFDIYQSNVNDDSYFGEVPEAKQKTVYVMYSPAIGNQPTPAELASKIIDMSDMYVDQYTSATNVSFTGFFRFVSNAIPYNSGICSFPPNIVTMSLQNEAGTNTYYESDLADYVSSNPPPETCVPDNISTPTYYMGITVIKDPLVLSPGRYVWKLSIAPGYTSILDFTLTVKYIAKTGGTTYCDLASPISNSGNNIYNASFGGGLRIKKIADYNAVNIPEKIKKYSYHFIQNECAPNIYRSYGRRMSRPIYSYFDDNWVVVELPAPMLGQANVRSQHLIRESESNIPLGGSASGNFIGYDKVTIFYGENGENGKTDYEFENEPDQIWDYSEYDNAPGGSYRIPRKPPTSGTFSNMSNGNLLKQTDYEKIGSSYLKVKEVETHYTEYLGQNNSLWYGIEKRKWNNVPMDVSANYGTDFRSFIYPSLTENRKLLDFTITRIYDKSNPGNVLTQTITNTYNHTTHLQLINTTETNSKGDETKTDYTYPSDYDNTAADAAITDMKSNTRFMHSSVVTKNTSIKRLGSSTFLLKSGIINKYQLNNGLINTKELSVLETTQPVTAPSAYVPSSGSYPAGFKLAINFDAYDLRGNILEQQKTNNVKQSYIWDYQGQYPVAEVFNASQTHIAYTSFEADGKGNWNFTNPVSAPDPTAPTGIRSNTLGNSITKSGLSTTTTYIVSYWKKSGTVAVNATTPITGRTVNGWTYYEHKVINPASGLITVSGTNGIIDELRLYPATNVQMTTYTYTPLIGINSQCDANNRITYYEYDRFNRLMLIRDQDKNILKQFCYNYNGQPENCNIAYNSLQSGTYYKSGCTGCLTGSAVTYTIPANTYSAATVTEANQLAINDIVVNGQAYADTNGTCVNPPNASVMAANGNDQTHSFYFQNTCTNLTYNFSIGANTPQNTIGTIPAGTYNVTFNPPSGSLQYTYMVNGYTLRANWGTIYNVSISASAVVVIIP